MKDRTSSSTRKSICELALLYGVQLAYKDVTGHRRQASMETLLAILHALGAPVERPQQVPDAIRQKRESNWQQCCQPVLVAWEGRLPAVKLRLPARLASSGIKWQLCLENGGEYSWTHAAGDYPIQGSASINGRKYIEKAFPSDRMLPSGYHQLSIELAGKLYQSLIISAPRRAYSTPPGTNPCWGAFVPLYALHSEESWGGGDFADLGALIHWLHALGSKFVATLPLLATFYRNSSDLSPYSPASRLFWNEVYLDMQSILQQEQNPLIGNMLNAPEFRKKLDALRRAPCVDYRAQMQLKRSVLERLLPVGEMPPGCRDYLQGQPLLQDYAEFRAACEKAEGSWHTWPQAQRDGRLTPVDFDHRAKGYYIYAQWLLERQLKDLHDEMSIKDMWLYFDLPLGVSPDSYDAWHERESFMVGISAGAPPDSFFSRGQDWGLAPLHPWGMRRQGYRYYINCLRHNLKYAGILRLDHIMSCHRLYVIPHGFEATQGAYIRYHPEEFYAIITLESQRARSLILGEDLGTVPAEVRKAMQRHHLYRHYVAQYEFRPDNGTMTLVPQKVIASINTHDMPAFAAFWHGQDIQERYHMGLLDSQGVGVETANRQHIRESLVRYLWENGFLPIPNPDALAALKGLLAFLASSRAYALLVNLEDLWGESNPQNVPGILDEKLNYCRKLRYNLEDFIKMPEVRSTLNQISMRRSRSRI